MLLALVLQPALKIALKSSPMVLELSPPLQPPSLTAVVLVQLSMLFEQFAQLFDGVPLREGEQR